MHLAPAVAVNLICASFMTNPDSTQQAHGYILNIATDRRELLLGEAQWGGVVAEVVPDFSHPRSYPLLCFVAFEDSAVTHVALGSLGGRAATGMKRLNLKDLLPLPALISHNAVLKELPPRLRRHVKPKLEAGGLLPPVSFVAFMKVIDDLLPKPSPLPKSFDVGRQAGLARLGNNAQRALAFQKEAVATSLALAGIDRTELLGWQPSADSGPPESFLGGLSKVRLLEDQVLTSDLATFPGLEIVRSMTPAVAVFTNGRVKLTVVMANRNPLEKQTGADLIYRNETYGSFVLVQYKMMENDNGDARFRLPNAQLARELRRMDELWNQIEGSEVGTGIDDYRLNANPCFLKLCPRIVFDPDNVGLAKGMYLPLDYWRRLEADPSIKGPMGGRAISFGNVGRYFNNTSFAVLVAGGWIGTTLPQTNVLDHIIRHIVEEGRTVTIAVKNDLGLEE